MSESGSFNGKSFIEGLWEPEDISEESTYAYNRWRQEQKRLGIAAEVKGWSVWRA